ncbi:alpha/beta hydrolase [Amphritea atlantica]|uniref:Alpha/beta hydrolase n=1 Tax=Amphritea atlantica TaxID=355243 RepID=A0ABY5GSI6_9GAMM|nr:alpha/beta hydrolase [Amphritea atlantica]
MPSCIINGQEMHYLDQGEGAPLLLGHGFLWDSRVWRPQLQFLSEHFRCIVPDLWSHGQSQTVSEGDLSIERLAEDHHQLMQHLNIDRYSIVGMSTGGLWGALLAMKYPDEVASLTLISCSLDNETASTRAEYLQLINAVESQAELIPEQLDGLVQINFSAQAQALYPALMETFRFDLMFLTPEQMSGLASMGRVLFQRQSLLDEVASVRCPALIIAGEEDAAYSLTQTQAMHDQMPGSQLTVFENAGHMLTLEQPDQVNAILVDFLASIDGVNLDMSKLVFS